MNSMTPAWGLGRRALALSALAGAILAAVLALAPDPAHAAYTARVEAGTLTIIGDSASDNLALRLQAGSSATLEIDVGADGTADFDFDRNTFTAIDVRARSGDDEVRIDQSNGAFIDELITMRGGSGADTLLGGSGGETFMGGSGDDFVDGNQGADLALLGGGADRFQWDPGDGSDVVEGQGGNDTLDFNGSNIGENIDVSAVGERVRFFRNIANIVMDLDGVEAIGFDALGGSDNVVVNDLAGTEADSVNVDLNAAGGGGDGEADTVVANGTEGPDHVGTGSGPTGEILVLGLSARVQVAGGEEANDNVNVAMLGGADAFTMDVGSTVGPAPINVDGGADADVVEFNGTAGADLIQLAANGLEASVIAPATTRLDVIAESLVLRGLEGADTFTSVGNLAAVTTLTYDGGADGDTMLGSNGADLLLGGSGDDFVDGQQGADLALLGSGDDRFQWDPGDGNDVVEGQDGIDTLDFNGSNIDEILEASANGPRVRFTRNIANIVMDLDDVEDLNVRSLGGADLITVNDLRGTDLDTADIDLSAIGGGGDGQPDSVIVNGTNRRDVVQVVRLGLQVVTSGLKPQTRVVGSEPANDTLRIQTLAGNDDVFVGPGVSDLIIPVIDLGVDE